jgi:L-threonylcarbamoyladenylate synthase
LITTRRFQSSELPEAAQLLAAGELVAFPTETVFGLGANALDAKAVGKIFVAKGRPSDNPLIVHLASMDELPNIASDFSKIAARLADAFWPGPLTLVVPKTNRIPSSVTAGLETVAVRIPNNPVALELIRLAKVPLAAPSANRSGRPSATTWQAVAEDLDNRIAGIVCGEPTFYGLESTVVDVSGAVPVVLRPGGISMEDLIRVVPSVIRYSGVFKADGSVVAALNLNSSGLNSPGLKHRHYQPRALVMLVDCMDAMVALPNDQTSSAKAYFIGLHPLRDPSSNVVQLVCQDVSDYASKLFDFFRQADQDQANAIYCERVVSQGLGEALMDRLHRAAKR